VEHAAQAFAGLAHQVADRARAAAHRVLAFAEIQQRVGGAAPAQLVVQAGQRDVVALAGQLAFVSTSFFGTMNSEMPRVPGTSLPSGPGSSPAPGG
jgi:hypothetical protein